jgi:hypothetical protein
MITTVICWNKWGPLWLGVENGTWWRIICNVTPNLLHNKDIIGLQLNREVHLVLLGMVQCT